ncbi:M13 family metallopeptidase [Longimicrobium sp.]|uniref:M13 family metallopeptidase n=1 Tax=Longimicrobium sp. TaxID=2029185 RepID=UPI002B63445E|nr:M13 family metallopeptidase [Longimicrobium sp.]HSU14062.1 M13 family metallopeptidase [Longimicrobium sp.]
MQTRVLLLVAPAVLAAGTAAAQGPVVPALDRANLDTTCAPCKNFYRYANGGWIARNPIPAAYSSWSGFNELRDRNEEVLRGVVEAAAREAGTTRDPNTRRVGNFYATCMDSSRAEAAGIGPIAADLRRQGAISTRQQLVDEVVLQHTRGTGVVFRFGGDQDPRNSARVIANLAQGGLGLPDRDYYLRDDSASRKTRADYLDNVTEMFVLAGETRAAARADADRIMALETALARASMTRVQQRDPNAQYHWVAVAEADRLAPGFSWSGFLRRVNVRADSVNVAQPDFFRAAAHELATRPLADWRAYLRYRTLSRAADWLSSPFVRQSFRYTQALTGAREQQPRWKRCLRLTDNALGDALGAEYVRVAFTPEAKAAMQRMVGNLRAAFADRIRASTWMGPATQRQALEKLGAFGTKIGYPDVWKDYTGLEIGTAGHIANLRALGEFEARRDRGKIGGPVDRTEWFMTVPTVNAYYSPNLNEVVFPAGRLQPPFFHVSYDVAANYGGIGGTIGHEMTHGFDDQGRQYDARGNLRDWWTPEDARGFEQRAAVVDRQYSAYTVLDSLHVNGKLTMGENIADIGGLSVAFQAMQRELAGQPRALIDGFTPEQRFFLAYAQARRATFRDQQLRLMVQTDPHSPNEFRVNGPLSNMPEFAAAFGCKAGDPMVRSDADRVNIW